MFRTVFPSIIRSSKLHILVWQQARVKQMLLPAASRDEIELHAVPSVKNLLKQQTLKQLKSVQLDKVLHMWCTAMCSEGNPMTRPMISKKSYIFFR